MFDVMRMELGELEKTLTYARRTYLWIPAITTDPAWDGRLGNLTITRQKSLKSQAKAEVTTYIVEPDVVVGEIAVAFLLAKQGPDGEVYRTVITTDPATDRCDCKAGSCKVSNCIHRDAVRTLLRDKLLPDFPAREIESAQPEQKEPPATAESRL